MAICCIDLSLGAPKPPRWPKWKCCSSRLKINFASALSLSLCFPSFSLTHSFSLSPFACTHKFQLTILPLIWQKQQKVTKQPLPLSAKLQFEILAPLPPKTPTKQAHLPISYTYPPLAPSHSLSLSLSAFLIRRLTMPIWQSLSSINYDYRHVL